MHLHKLSLIDFKNIAEAHIELSPQINCLVGDNGTGKTNLLDAVHYLSVGKSGFNFADSQCIRHGADAFLIDGVYRTSEDRIWDGRYARVLDTDGVVEELAVR